MKVSNGESENGISESEKEVAVQKKAEELVGQLKSGQHGNFAFGELYKLYAPMIDAAVSKCIFSGELPESEYDDLRQEAVIALYYAALAYDTDKYSASEADKKHVSFGLFAKICVGNRLVSVLRKLSSTRKRQLSIDTDTAPGLSTNGDELAENLIAGEKAAAVSAAAQSELSDLEMRVFREYMSGKTSKSIASQLNQSTKTIDNALYRIKKKIKAKLM